MAIGWHYSKIRKWGLDVRVVLYPFLSPGATQHSYYSQCRQQSTRHEPIRTSETSNRIFHLISTKGSLQYRPLTILQCWIKQVWLYRIYRLFQSKFQFHFYNFISILPTILHRNSTSARNDNNFTFLMWLKQVSTSGQQAKLWCSSATSWWDNEVVS